MILTLDMECNGLEPTKIHCVVLKELHRDNYFVYTEGNRDELRGTMDATTILCGHNLYGFDLPIIKKLWGIDLYDKVINDTLLLSKLLNPDREKHSLKWWGEQIGEEKIEFNEWDEYTPQMLEYCKQDVNVTEKVYDKLLEEAKGWDWRRSYRIEREVAEIIYRQEQHGVLFDSSLAADLVDELVVKMQEIEAYILPLLPHKEIPESRLHYPPKLKFKKSGEPSALAVKYFSHRLYNNKGIWLVQHPDGGSYPLATATEPLHTYEAMKLSDGGVMKQWIVKQYGWQPTIWNTVKDKETGKSRRTTPKFTDMYKNICPNLDRIQKDIPFVGKLVLWLSYRNRRNVIRSENGTGWLNHSRLAIDGRLPSSADTIGTNTGRFTHRVIANVPRCTSIYGREMRSLFTVPEGKVLVGWDASALEARVEGHYTWRYDNGSYASILLDGDIHQANADVFECDRETSKATKYAITYGCQPEKLAQTLHCTLDRAKGIYRAFWETSTSLGRLKRDVTAYWKEHGHLIGLDGRKVMVRSEHSLVNALFQSAGAIAMKVAMIWWDEQVRKERLNAHQIIHYHDEVQVEEDKNDVEFMIFNSEIEANDWNPSTKLWSNVGKKDDYYYRAYSRAGELGVLSIREAGKQLGLRVPLDATYAIGTNWSHTH